MTRFNFKTRAQQAATRQRALRLFLQQSRGVDAWSDGNRIIEGDELAKLRSRAVHKLIEMRAPRAPDAVVRKDMAWRNLAALWRMQGPRDFAERLRADYCAALQLKDPSSQARVTLLRRVLRKQHPDLFRALPPKTRHGSPELSYIVQAMNRKTLVTREGFEIDGIEIPAGEEVKIGSDGYPQLVKDWLPRDVLGAGSIRVKRSRAPSADREIERGPEPV